MMEEQPLIVNPIDRVPFLDQIRSSIPKGGAYAGWEELGQIYTAKKGFPLVVYGAPHSGKSVFVLNLLVNLSRQHGWKHLVLSSEQGSVDDLTLEISEIYLRQPVRKFDEKGNARQGVADDASFYHAQEWVAEHFRFIDPTAERCQSFTLADFHSWAREVEESGFRLDTTCLDPFNDVQPELPRFGGRQDLWLTQVLKEARDEAAKYNRLDILVKHIAQQQQTMISERGQRFSPPALMSEIAGGQSTGRRAFTVLLVYRPPSNDLLKFGKHVVQTRHGESWIICQKAKPRGAAQLGQAILYYDQDTGCFCERTDHDGKEKYYAGELRAGSTPKQSDLWA